VVETEPSRGRSGSSGRVARDVVVAGAVDRGQVLVTWQFVAKHEALAGFVACSASMLACCGASFRSVWAALRAQVLVPEGVSEFFDPGGQLLQKAASEALYEDEVVLRCSTPAHGCGTSHTTRRSSWPLITSRR